MVAGLDGSEDEYFDRTYLDAIASGECPEDPSTSPPLPLLSSSPSSSSSTLSEDHQAMSPVQAAQLGCMIEHSHTHSNLKRRRLCTKTKVDWPVVRNHSEEHRGQVNDLHAISVEDSALSFPGHEQKKSCQVHAGPICVDERVFPNPHQWLSWRHRKRYLWCVEQIRCWFCKNKSTYQRYCQVENYRLVREAFGALSQEQKSEVMSQYCSSVSLPSYIKEDVLKIFAQQEKVTRVFGKTLLLTYNGEWGLRSVDGTGFLLVPGMPVDEAVVRCRQESVVINVWEEFKEFGAELAKTLRCSDHSVCMEICAETLASSDIARCHMHMWMRHNKNIFVPDMDSLAFGSITPHFASVIGGMAVSNRSASFVGMLYTSSLKYGSVFSHGTRQPFSGYLVQPSWLMNFLQGGKITMETCKSGIIKSCQNVARYLTDLQMLETHYRNEKFEAEQRRVSKVLAARKRPFIDIPSVQTWLQQYSDDNFRYKFLVLDGPSRFGKTTFVTSLLGDDQAVLELTCSGGAAIDLKMYQRHKHKLILFDEIEAPQVLSNKKLFQAGPAPVQLGQSQTGMYCYTVFVYRTMLVCSSNCWSESFSKLRQSDAAWIEANQVYVAVDDYLFT